MLNPSALPVSSVRAARLSAVYIPLVMFFSSLTTAIVLARGGALRDGELDELQQYLEELKRGDRP